MPVAPLHSYLLVQMQVDKHLVTLDNVHDQPVLR